MATRPHLNILMLQEVAKGLGELRDKVVFVGGAVTGLYINDPHAYPVTVSDDVDCVVEVTGRIEYSKIEKRLGQLGFKRPLDDDDIRIICRWQYNGITVDVMPTDETILGFTNRWYKEAMREKVTVTLPNSTSISIFSLPYFIATKLEAFKGRGRSYDWRSSQDLEDIVDVLGGCKEVETHLAAAPKHLKKYLRAEFSVLLEKRDDLMETIFGFLRDRGDHVLPVIDRIVGL